jgi:hypothetical protein
MQRKIIGLARERLEREVEGISIKNERNIVLLFSISRSSRCLMYKMAEYHGISV